MPFAFFVPTFAPFVVKKKSTDFNRYHMRFVRIFSFLMLLPCVSAMARQPIVPNRKPVNFSLKKGQEKSFVFSCTKGKPYTIQAEQKGIDVAVTLKTPQGRVLHRHDSPNGMYGPETVEFTADSFDTYLIDVVPLAETGNAEKGKFSICVKDAVKPDRDTTITTILSPKVMEKDLRIFRAIRQKANSGLYRYRTPQQIDSIYAWAHTRIERPLHVREFYKIILALTDFEGSCHNGTRLPHDMLAYLPRERSYFPYYLRWIEGSMVVDIAGKTLPLGTKILAVNGMPAETIMRALYKYSTTDGYNVTQKQSFSVNKGFGWRFAFEFGFSDGYVVQYTLPGSTDTLTTTLKGASTPEKQENYRNRHSAKMDSLIDGDVQELYGFRMLDAGTGLLNVREFTMAANDQDPAYGVYAHFLDSVFQMLKTRRVPNLIIDIRNNPGGSNPNDLKLFTYLAQRPFRENKHAYIAFDKVPLPQYFVWDSSDPRNQKRERRYQEKEWRKEFSVREKDGYAQHQGLNPYWYPDSNRFDGKIYVLIDENVGSAASHFAAHVRDNSAAVLVGIETVGGYYEHNGHIPVEYELPGSKIRTRFSIVCVSQDVSENPKQPKGRGVIPDYVVSQSYDDYINRRDTQMEFVLALIRKNMP